MFLKNTLTIHVITDGWKGYHSIAKEYNITQIPNEKRN